MTKTVNNLTDQSGGKGKSTTASTTCWETWIRNLLQTPSFRNRSLRRALATAAVSTCAGLGLFHCVTTPVSSIHAQENRDSLPSAAHAPPPAPAAQNAGQQLRPVYYSQPLSPAAVAVLSSPNSGTASNPYSQPPAANPTANNSSAPVWTSSPVYPATAPHAPVSTATVPHAPPQYAPPQYAPFVSDSATTVQIIPGAKDRGPTAVPAEQQLAMPNDNRSRPMPAESSAPQGADAENVSPVARQEALHAETQANGGFLTMPADSTLSSDASPQNHTSPPLPPPTADAASSGDRPAMAGIRPAGLPGFAQDQKLPQYPVPPVPQPLHDDTDRLASPVLPLDPRNATDQQMAPSNTGIQATEDGRAGGQPAVLQHPPAVRVGGHSTLASIPGPGMSGFRATIESDAPQWLGGYQNRANRFPQQSGSPLVANPGIQLPADYQAWWDSMVRSQMGIAPTAIPVDVGSLVQRAMSCSPQVLALQAEPEVQQRVVWQEEAAFDWRAFMETTYSDLNDPIGNRLTTGNLDNRFLDNQLIANGGVRRKTTTGAEVSLAQRFGHQDNNSTFLNPNSQSTSKLELSFRQPLLNRAGVALNQNQIILARIATNTSSDEVLTEIQNHLYKVTEAYWQLYRARAEFAQRQKLLASARTVLAKLEGRYQVDTIPRQILRAKAAVARAEARIQRAVTSIRNTESQLRLLVNDPQMLNSGPIEFLPTEMPLPVLTQPGLRDSLQTAIVNRPDISRAIRQMRASGVRLGVSKNEMLPKLDFIIRTYVAGLERQDQIPEAIGNQFADGGVSYTVGMEFEVPLGNRAAKAKNEQRQWELRRSINVFRATVETSLTEVEVANREVETAYREMLGRFEAMTAAQNETNYLQDRFEVLPMIEDSAILLLENLLDGFERLADEESAFVESQINYALSIINLRRATGVLLRSRHDEPVIRTDESEWMNTRLNATSGPRTVESATSGSSAGITPPPVQTSPIRSASDSAVPPTWSQPVGLRPSAASGPATGPGGGHSLTRYR